MKIRFGFVTNSSSTSYVLMPKANFKPQVYHTVEELNEFMDDMFGADFEEYLEDDKWFMSKAYRKAVNDIAATGTAVILVGSMGNDNWFSDLEDIMGSLGYDVAWGN